MQSVMRGCGCARRCLEEGQRGDRAERDGLPIEKKGSSNGRAGDEEAEKMLTSWMARASVSRKGWSDPHGWTVRSNRNR